MASRTMNKVGKCLGSFVLAIAVHGGASAGWVEGPYPVWVNLSKHPKPVDSRVRNYLNSGKGKDSCWSNGALLYMRDKPAGVTKELVRRAVLEKNPGAMRALSRVLKHPFDGPEGLDGVIVYDDENGPTYYGFTTGKTRVKVYKMPDLTHVEEGMCAVIPDITRKP